MIKTMLFDMTNAETDEDYEFLCEEYTNWFKPALVDAMENYDYIMIRGSVQRWNGVSSGYDWYRGVDDALYRCLKDVEDFTIQWGYTESGDLAVSGAHHDGSVYFEFRGFDSYAYDELDLWECDETDEYLSPKSPEQVWNEASKIDVEF